MSTAVICPTCQKSLRLRDDLIGKRVRCPHCRNGVRPVAAVARPTAPDVLLPAQAEHALRAFPAALVMFLGIATCSTFATLRLLWLHNAFPKRRPRDPSAAQAIGLALLPIYNLYWGPFALGRLLTRLNEQRRQWGLPELRLYWLVAVFTAGMLAPLMLPFVSLQRVNAGRPFDLCVFVLALAGPLLNWFVFVPLLASAVQNAINGLVEACAAPQAQRRMVLLTRIELKWRARQRLVWAIYLAVIAAPHLFLVALNLASNRGSDRFTVAAMHFALFDVPLVLGSVALLTRAVLMHVAAARLARLPGDLTTVVAAEQRTTWVFHTAWCMLLGGAGVLMLGFLLWQQRGWHGVGGLLDEVLVPALFLVLPAWVASVLLLGRVMQGPTPTIPSPAHPLQCRPMPRWPMAASSILTVMFVAATFGCQLVYRWHVAAHTTSADGAPARSQGHEPR